MKKTLIALALVLSGAQSFAGNAACELAAKNPQAFKDVGIGRVLMVNIVMQGAGSGDDSYDDQIMINLERYSEAQQNSVVRALTSIQGLDVESLILELQSHYLRSFRGAALVEKIFQDVRAKVCSERFAGICDPNLQRCRSLPQEKSEII